MVMKKFLICLIFALSALECYPQSLKFILHRDGSFLTEDGNDYVVLSFDGKTAKDLYDIVHTNAMSFYKSPKNVLSVNEGVSIAVRAYTDTLIYGYGGYYYLCFEFKDGRMKVVAPSADELYYTNATLAPSKFCDMVKYLFERTGHKNAKKAAYAREKLEAVELHINYAVNYLVGLLQSSPSNKEW